MDLIKTFLNYTFQLGKDIQISVKAILILLLIFSITAFILRTVRQLVTRKMAIEDSKKFVTVFSYVKYFIFLLVFFFSLDNIGVDVTAIFAASAALLIGVGLAMQTLFQDIISGVFILLDQSVHVNDIIEIEGKVGKVTNINLRTTKALTIENKVLIIPNHLYLSNTLYNWTQNEQRTREFVDVGVAYGSDVQLVKQLLLEAANTMNNVLKEPEPTVFFRAFGESSLDFRLVVTIQDSFMAVFPKSDLHFEIDRLFRANNITIPFPQRDVHIHNPK